ncbi:MAG: RagB/SusD family nutrient uptake outer membrane protein [Bacteroidales bacterium]|nr:MAG: RagB/SusD family nutrient uptake outer membrane protein [Bacteroidales bacterium]
MRKIIFIIIVIFLIISCSEDFVDRLPTTSSVVENFYRTPEDATQAITSVYNMLLHDDWWCSMIYSEIASDNCAGGAGTGDGGGFTSIDRGMQLPGPDVNQEAWTYYYGGIYRANVYLENEELIDWTENEALRLQYQAEARFLRGYFHFYLTRMFGEIPALDHTITPDDIPGRTPAEELYGLIMDDLIFCAENGLSANYDAMEPENWGRATKWAAEAMAVRVYMFYRGYYNDPDLNGFTAEDARGYIDDVINNSRHDLVPEFASLWRVPTYSELGGDTSIERYAGEVNPEVIWSVRYNPSGNPFRDIYLRMIGPRNTNIEPYGQGWGATPVLPSLWYAYDTNDTRRTATILSWDDEGLVYDYVANQQAQYSGYNTKKYMLAYVNGQREANPDWQTDGFEDYIVIRFADVLLMGAELHLIAGNEGTALDYINRVRERAFGSDSINYTSITIDSIFAERKLELACEGIQYWDVLRSCNGDFTRLADILTYIDTTDGGDFSNSVNLESLDVDGNNFVLKKGLFPIPENEILLMEGVIEQNPGY